MHSHSKQKYLFQSQYVYIFFEATYILAAWVLYMSEVIMHHER